ncbi:MAG: spore coat protein, partial [Pelotomaculum sp.]|nr:spore coat protein [Pelotomaculum sp.]
MLEEKDRLTDSLITQKYIASGYNMAAIESANNQLMDT